MLIQAIRKSFGKAYTRIFLKSKEIIRSLDSMEHLDDSKSSVHGNGKVESLDKTASQEQLGIKRMAEDSANSEHGPKKLKAENENEKEWPFQKKKLAMLLVYSGKGYLGMQRNPGFKTIESDLLSALAKAGVVRPDHIEQPGSKMGFQRAARTDKGVSAAGQVVSLKMFVDVENALEKINSNLPSQIRVLGFKRTTKSFDSKNACNSRTYIYITPTFSFAPIDELLTEEYRISEEVLKRVQEILCLFRGTHNFHNFTSGKKPNDPSANRYIMEFQVGKPFERMGMEYVVITVKGQSFMLHQIRKMIGLTMAIVRGFAGIDTLERSWLKDKVDVPKAPGLGLVLDKVHYDAYNKRFGSDGLHDAIDWNQYKDEIESFKEDYIYPTIFSTEKEEKSMMNWLSTLPLHHYESIEGKLSDTSPMARAHHLAEEALKETSTSGPENLGTVHQSTTTEVTTPIVEISTTVAVEKSTPVAVEECTTTAVQDSTTTAVQDSATTAVQDSTTTAVQDSTILDNIQLLVNDQLKK